MQPIIAGLNREDDGTYALSLVWLESASDAHGIQLSDATGVVGDFDRCFPPLTKDELTVRATTLLRRTIVLFDADTNAETVRRGAFRIGRALSLPPLKVRIRSNDGTESAEVEAMITWARGVENGETDKGRDG